MADVKKSVAEIAGDYLLERRRAVGDAAAERRGHPTGASELARKQEREAFWKRFVPPEQEPELWAKGMAEGKTLEQVRADVSAAVYPRRWEVFSKKGELPDRLAWAKQMAKLGPLGDDDADEEAQAGPDALPAPPPMLAASSPYAAPPPPPQAAPSPVIGEPAAPAGAGYLDALLGAAPADGGLMR